MYSQQILRTGPDPSPLPSSCSSLLRLMYQKLLCILHGVLNIQWMAFPELSSRCYLGPGIKKTIYTFLCICAGTARTPWTKRTASKLVIAGRKGRRGRNLCICIYLSGLWKYSVDNYISFISWVPFCRFLRLDVINSKDKSSGASGVADTLNKWMCWMICCLQIT